MSKSRAKKLREKLIREGKLNPVVSRSSFASTEMYKFMQQKKSETKIERLRKQEIKYKGRLSNGINDNGPFYLSA